MVKAAFWLTLLLFTGSAVAQQRSSMAEARTAFEHGAAALEAGRFEEAAAAFERSRSISDLAVVEYDLGLAYRGAGHRAQAVAAFERYLANPEPDASADDIAAIRRALTELRDELRSSPYSNPEPAASAAPASAAPPATAAAPTPDRRMAGGAGTWTIVGIAGLGTAAASLTAGLVGWIVRESAVDSYNSRCHGIGDPMPPPGCSEASAISAAGAGQTLAAVTIPTGAVLAAVSAVVLGVSSRHAERPRTTVTAGPSGIGLEVSF